MIEKRKAFAYVTQGRRLLVFEHPFAPEAGIQIPAGTIELGEAPEVAVLREAHEETGLTGLRLGAFLGEQRRDMSDLGKAESHHRYFYQVICEQEAPESWDWGERFPSDEAEVYSTFRHVFRFYWVELPDGVPELIADHGAMVEKLVTLL